MYLTKFPPSTTKFNRSFFGLMIKILKENKHMYEIYEINTKNTIKDFISKKNKQ